MTLRFFTLLFITLSLCWLPVVKANLPVKELGGTMIPTLAPIIKQSESAVVNIATSTQQQMNHPLFSNPFFREFYNIPKNYQLPSQKAQSAGSGVIINGKEGILITNHHVIDGADKIEIILSNGDLFEAKHLGSDPEVDIAVLKVDRKKLPSITLGDSDKMEVGDFVVAIGNPFGLNQTVTTGIVSALGRSGLGIEGYEDFIQTDASINPGNSGGALINLKGELIGINTAIIAPAKGNVGIGFAIPINMAMNSVNQIIKHGEVKRGQLGIIIQDVTDELAKAFSLPNQHGVLVAKVQKDSTADKAGITSGDVIIAVDGQKVSTAAQLRNKIGAKRIDDKVKLSLYRNGKKKELSVKVGGKYGFSDQFDLNTGISKKLNGLSFKESNAAGGLEITQIAVNSDAAQSGLHQGDIILSANQQPVNSVQDLQKALTLNKHKLLLQIQRGRGVFYLVIQ